MQLICLTYAGGTAAFYDQIKNRISKDIHVVALEYAGHGKRHKEPFYNDFSELVADMFSKIKEQIAEEEDYAIMGYSMGSISAVELLKHILQDSSMKQPKYVFLAAHEPFTKKELRDFASGELDQYVKERTIQFGGISEKLVSNDSFWRVYLPIYRADYSLIGKYRFEDLDLRTNIPVTVFYSESDTPLEVIKEWRIYFTGVCEFLNYEGNHFFINDHCDEIVKEIRNRLVM